MKLKDVNFTVEITCIALDGATLTESVTMKGLKVDDEDYCSFPQHLYREISEDLPPRLYRFLKSERPESIPDCDNVFTPWKVTYSEVPQGAKDRQLSDLLCNMSEVIRKLDLILARTKSLEE